MIEIRHVTKCFDSIKALNDVTFTIPKGRIFGLLGTNGAGKSTLLRAMAGILACDAGEILIEGEACYDNPQGKERFFYLPDDPYYFPNATMETMTDFYRRQYPGMGQYRKLWSTWQSGWNWTPEGLCEHFPKE